MTRNGTESQGDATDTSQCNNDGSCAADGNWNGYDGNYDDGDEAGGGEANSNGGGDNATGDNGDGEEFDGNTMDPVSVALSHTRMITSVKRSWSPRSVAGVKSSVLNEKSRLPEDALPSVTTSIFDLSTSRSSSTDDSDVMSGPPNAAEDAGKTTRPKAQPTSSKKAPPNTKASTAKPSPTGNAKCTPSPTKSLAPSASKSTTTHLRTWQ